MTIIVTIVRHFPFKVCTYYISNSRDPKNINMSLYFHQQKEFSPLLSQPPIIWVRDYGHATQSSFPGNSLFFSFRKTIIT